MSPLLLGLVVAACVGWLIVSVQVLMIAQRARRDYFAAKAMQGEMITSTSDATPEAARALMDAAHEAGRTYEEQIAFRAYSMADAMLKARTA